MKRISIVALFLALFVVAGCSGNVKVSGTVSFSDDGAPVESGMVYFVSKTSDFSARGNIVDGKYVVSSIKENDGLPKGDYDVYFSGIEKIVKEGQTLENGDTIDPQTAPAIDLKYLSASTSGFSEKIDGSRKDLDFKLDRAPQ